MYSMKFAREENALYAEQGAHDATRRCYDVMVAVSALHAAAAKWSSAAQQSFETELEVEDGFEVRPQATADAKAAAEAKKGFDEAVERLNRAIARLTVAG